MLMDNNIFRGCFLAFCLGGLLMVWSQKPAGPSAEAEGQGANRILSAKLSPKERQGLSNASKIIDAALRDQMTKLSKRTVNLLTVGPSAPNLESATIRAIGDLFSKVQIRSVSDYKNADELVGEWRKSPDTPPSALVPVLALGDLTIVQWLEQGATGLELTTWYVAKNQVLSRDVYPWGDGTLPQETIDKLNRVILSPDLKVGG
jgi:hypothetical protein